MTTKYELAQQSAINTYPRRFLATGRFLVIGRDSQLDRYDKFTPNSTIVPELTSFGRAFFENPFARILSKIFNRKKIDQIMSIHDRNELVIKVNRKKLKGPNEIVIFDRDGHMYEKLNS